MYRPLRAFCLGGLILLIQACSLFETKDTTVESGYLWSELEPKLSTLTSWELLGKVNIRTPEESVTAAINSWKQNGEIFNIDLSSTFLGLGATNISGTRHFVTLIESGEKPLISNQPNELINQALGLPLPITNLQYWIRALPNLDSQADITFSESGLPQFIRQDNWQIEYSRYSQDHAFPLPEKIKLTRDSIRITLVIKEWTLP